MTIPEFHRALESAQSVYAHMRGFALIRTTKEAAKAWGESVVRLTPHSRVKIDNGYVWLGGLDGEELEP